MIQSWQDLRDAVAAAAIALGAAALFFAGIALVWEYYQSKRRPKAELPHPVIRDVLEFQETEAGIVVRMECGHLALLPNRIACHVCTREIEQLQKMAGEL